MLNSGTLSPNPGIYRFSARMIVYTEVTCTEDKAPQGCDPSADARAGMARGGLPAAPNSNPRLPRAIAYCRPKMVLTMGSTLPRLVVSRAYYGLVTLSRVLHSFFNNFGPQNNAVRLCSFYNAVVRDVTSVSAHWLKFYQRAA